MRIDKFLKVSRLIKRRTIANQITKNDRILVNQKVVKPSYQVKLEDLITIEFGTKIITVKVKSLLDSTKKSDADTMYEFISEERRER